MSWSVKLRLGAMMFLQYAIWGAWAPVLWPYLTTPSPNGLGLTDPQAGFIFGLLWLACILAPFTGGQIADRWVPTQWFLAVVHLIGGGVMIYASKAQSYQQMAVLMGIYAILYAPTLALTNSLGFHHIKDEKSFGYIRVFGTIGWIIAGWGLTAWRILSTPGATYYDWVQPIIAFLKQLHIPVIPPQTADCLMLAGVFGILMGVLCLFLPNTPPAREKAADPFAFREAFVMLKNPNFLVFMIIAFVVTTELQFYYGPTGGFLEGALKINHASIPFVMSVAQIAEIIAMSLILPIALRKWGVRKTLALGTIAWPARYIIFAIAPLGPVEVMRPIVVASLAFHGLGYTFFFVASQIFVDMVAPKDIRASAQSLLTLATLGIGNWLGTIFTGYIMRVFNPAANVQAWTSVFLVPCALTVACAIAFLLFFKDPKAEAAKAEAP